MIQVEWLGWVVQRTLASNANEVWRQVPLDDYSKLGVPCPVGIVGAVT